MLVLATYRTLKSLVIKRYSRDTTARLTRTNWATAARRAVGSHPGAPVRLARTLEMAPATATRSAARSVAAPSSGTKVTDSPPSRLGLGNDGSPPTIHGRTTGVRAFGAAASLARALRRRSWARSR